ncbi:putative molybdenum carrier protein [Candidatus Binatia bacterium]|jgi:hypothetical protein|nr:putative molybdenum carrier protein [Candidatus Binatia bacterium]
MSEDRRTTELPVRKIVSGGQAGVDRGALDVALALGIPCGGWCPKGRLAEDGVIDERYPLRETRSTRYARRTLWNVRDSDATLILARTPLGGGTAYTERCARDLERPSLVVAPDACDAETLGRVRAWLRAHDVEILNVAGPRESGAPGIRDLAVAFLRALLAPRRPGE